MDVDVEDDILNEFGRRVRSERVAQGLNQAQLAERVDISRVWLSKIERGQVPTLSLPLVEKISRVLGLGLLGGPIAGSSDAETPDALQQFAEEKALPPADVEMLAGIHYRGKQPKTAKEWRLLYRVIQAVVDAD